MRFLLFLFAFLVPATSLSQPMASYVPGDAVRVLAPYEKWCTPYVDNDELLEQVVANLKTQMNVVVICNNDTVREVCPSLKGVVIFNNNGRFLQPSVVSDCFHQDMVKNFANHPFVSTVLITSNEIQVAPGSWFQDQGTNLSILDQVVPPVFYGEAADVVVRTLLAIDAVLASYADPKFLTSRTNREATKNYEIARDKAQRVIDLTSGPLYSIWMNNVSAARLFAIRVVLQSNPTTPEALAKDTTTLYEYAESIDTQVQNSKDHFITQVVIVVFSVAMVVVLYFAYKRFVLDLKRRRYNRSNTIKACLDLANKLLATAEKDLKSVSAVAKNRLFSLNKKDLHTRVANEIGLLIKRHDLSVAQKNQAVTTLHGIVYTLKYNPSVYINKRGEESAEFSLTCKYDDNDPSLIDDIQRMNDLLGTSHAVISGDELFSALCSNLDFATVFKKSLQNPEFVRDFTNSIPGCQEEEWSEWMKIDHTDPEVVHGFRSYLGSAASVFVDQWEAVARELARFEKQKKWPEWSGFREELELMKNGKFQPLFLGKWYFHLVVDVK